MAEVDLDGAIREKRGELKKTKIVEGLVLGDNPAYFVGLHDNFTDHTNFPCNPCRGQGTIRGEQCRTCGGTGKKTEEKTHIRYQVGADLYQDEIVSFKLSPPETVNGQARKASTLYLRLARISGLTDKNEIRDWYKALPRPIKVPCTIVIDEKIDSNELYIDKVRARATRTHQVVEA